MSSNDSTTLLTPTEFTMIGKHEHWITTMTPPPPYSILDVDVDLENPKRSTKFTPRSRSWTSNNAVVFLLFLCTIAAVTSIVIGLACLVAWPLSWFEGGMVGTQGVAGL